MFKQILYSFLIILIILSIVYFIIKNILISTHKLYIDNLKIKYIAHDSDLDYLKKYSKEVDLYDLKEETNCIFYTTKKWSTKNNNFIKFKERYYIIEPGYYYYINKNVKESPELYLNNNCKINVKKNNCKV